MSSCLIEPGVESLSVISSAVISATFVNTFPEFKSLEIVHSICTDVLVIIFSSTLNAGIVTFDNIVVEATLLLADSVQPYLLFISLFSVRVNPSGK